MTTERELLELAAKACGADFRSYLDCGLWNALMDDGDCARMEATLGIELTWFFDRVDALACDVAPVVEYFKDYAGDKSAARRAASVAVASEIGRLK